jgi:hypothetical protein
MCKRNMRRCFDVAPKQGDERRSLITHSSSSSEATLVSQIQTGNSGSGSATVCMDGTSRTRTANESTPNGELRALAQSHSRQPSPAAITAVCLRFQME